MKERSTKEQEKEKGWLLELAEFIVEANQNTWAAEGAEVEPDIKGFKTLEYKKGDWELRDSYTGYFKAPGLTTVFYKDFPVWGMAYAGAGMTEGLEHLAKKTFQTLRHALMEVDVNLPYRGPEIFDEGTRRYTFELIDGDITDFLWVEHIYDVGVLTFTQTGAGGIVIHKDSEGKPLLPWNL